MDKMDMETRLLHGYPVLDQVTGASSIPKYQASTFHQADFRTHDGYTYTRFGNPTIAAAEACMAELEHGEYALAFSSGMGAINAALFLLSQGDHIVLCHDIYGGTFQTLTEMLTRFGVTYTFVEASQLANWEEAIRPETKFFYIETPSNPLLHIVDIQGVVEIATQHGIQTICDNTFMTPCYQNPLDLGVDIVVQSATKFLNGHSDVVAGFLVMKDGVLYEQLKRHQKMLGAILGVEEAWLFLRGVKTLALRMEKSVASALVIAEHLQTKKHVLKVYYPGLDSHPGSEIQQQQARSGGAVLSFELPTVEAVYCLFESIKVPIVAVSLGGVESILSYPWSMSHGCMPESERLAVGVTPTLVRLSVGIESVTDLIADLDQCLN